MTLVWVINLRIAREKGNSFNVKLVTERENKGLHNTYIVLGVFLNWGEFRGLVAFVIAENWSFGWLILFADFKSSPKVNLKLKIVKKFV
jgi:hypothetical protein